MSLFPAIGINQRTYVKYSDIAAKPTREVRNAPDPIHTFNDVHMELVIVPPVAKAPITSRQYLLRLR